jgi:hypothetical protein
VPIGHRPTGKRDTHSSPLAQDRIAGITSFLGAEAFESFDLPARHPAFGTNQ